jgi:tetratricopeptide (TPR) repeat protein
MIDFFISYNKKDKDWAEWIAWQLEEAGHSTILQAWDFRPGSSFVMEMQKATSGSERTIAVLSPHYLQSNFTQPEWSVAFAKDPTGENGLLLPIRVKECTPEGVLPKINYIDLLNLDETKAKQILLEGIERGRAKPEKKPDFPGKKTRSVASQLRFPGSFPIIWNVPYLQNRNFTGRDDVLKYLRSSLTSGNYAALTQAISGLGGVGKTQIATEYAFRHAGDYELIWWIRSEDIETLNADYVQLAFELDLPVKDVADQKVMVTAVRNWLNQNTNWLLIFDNAEDPSHLKEFLPQMQAGHVIITSRNPSWRGVATPLEVEIWTPKESTNFLLTRTGLTDDKAASDLANELGHLPLALEQAGAYIEAKNISVASYLELFKRDQRVLLKQLSSLTGYANTIETTWNISFNEVNRENPASIELLKICAFLSPEPIQSFIFVRGANFLPERLQQLAQNPFFLDYSMSLLRKYSLIERTGDQFTIHRLLQLAIKEQLNAEEKKYWIKVALSILDESFPIDFKDSKTSNIARLLMEHVKEAVINATAEGVEPEQTVSLIVRVGRVYLERKEYRLAKETFHNALYLTNKLRESVETRLTKIKLFEYLGQLSLETNQLNTAKEFFEKALNISIEVFGEHHPNVVYGLNNIGNVLSNLGDFQKAREYFEKALIISSETLGSRHPNVVYSLNNIGNVLSNLGDFQKAREYFEKALSISIDILGSHHPDVARTLNNLSFVYLKLNDSKRAKEYSEKALAIIEKAFGPDHPEIAANLHSIGKLHIWSRDYHTAQAYLDRALRIYEGNIPQNTLAIAEALVDKGNLLRIQNDISSSRSCYERALIIYEAELGNEHSKSQEIRELLHI